MAFIITAFAPRPTDPFAHQHQGSWPESTA